MQTIFFFKEHDFSVNNGIQAILGGLPNTI